MTNLPCFSDSDSRKTFKNLLILTTSGGGGHLQAAAAIKQEFLEKNEKIEIIERNIVQIAGGKLFGKFMIEGIWNSAQKNGSVKALDLCAIAIPLFDFLFGASIFFQIFWILKKKNIEHIIDTQPMTTFAITLAARFYNYLYKKNLKVEKYLTELPTKYAYHYFRPIKNLPQKNKEILTLVTTYPLTETNQTSEMFWEKLSGLSQKQIHYNNLPLRKNFKKIVQRGQTGSQNSISIQIKNEEEKTLLLECLKLSSHPYLINDSSLTISFDSRVHYLTLMLGSQPVQEASLNYVKEFIEFVKEQKTLQRFVFFVFCSDKKSDLIPLQKRIHLLLKETPNFPSQLLVVPMSSQEDDVIAPLFYRSSATITKAGGITSMELLSVSQGKIWIHKEEEDFLTKFLTFSKSEINSFKGMPKWEAGNALYLKKKKDATSISPKRLKEQCHLLFDSIDKNLDQQELQQNLSNS